MFICPIDLSSLALMDVVNPFLNFMKTILNCRIQESWSAEQSYLILSGVNNVQDKLDTYIKKEIKSKQTLNITNPKQEPIEG